MLPYIAAESLIVVHIPHSGAPSISLDLLLLSSLSTYPFMLYITVLIGSTMNILYPSLAHLLLPK